MVKKQNKVAIFLLSAVFFLSMGLFAAFNLLGANKVYAEDSPVSLSGVTSFTPVAGGSVRKKSDFSGLRFTFTLNTGDYNGVKLYYESVEFGMFILPRSMYETNAVTEDSFFGTGENKIYTDSIEKAEGKQVIIHLSASEMKYNNDKALYCFNGVISGIKQKNYTLEFVGVPYIKAVNTEENGGSTEYLFANSTIEESAGHLKDDYCRSVVYVAQKAIEKGETDEYGVINGYVDYVKENNITADYTISREFYDTDGETLIRTENAVKSAVIGDDIYNHYTDVYETYMGYGNGVIDGSASTTVYANGKLSVVQKFVKKTGFDSSAITLNDFSSVVNVGSVSGHFNAPVVNAGGGIKVTAAVNVGWGEIGLPLFYSNGDGATYLSVHDFAALDSLTVYFTTNASTKMGLAMNIKAVDSSTTSLTFTGAELYQSLLESTDTYREDRSGLFFNVMSMNAGEYIVFTKIEANISTGFNNNTYSKIVSQSLNPLNTTDCINTETSVNWGDKIVGVSVRANTTTGWAPVRIPCYKAGTTTLYSYGEITAAFDAIAVDVYLPAAMRIATHQYDPNGGSSYHAGDNRVIIPMTGIIGQGENNAYNSSSGLDFAPQSIAAGSSFIIKGVYGVSGSEYHSLNPLNTTACISASKIWWGDMTVVCGVQANSATNWAPVYIPCYKAGTTLYSYDEMIQAFDAIVVDVYLPNAMNLAIYNYQPNGSGGYPAGDNRIIIPMTGIIGQGENNAYNSSLGLYFAPQSIAAGSSFVIKGIYGVKNVKSSNILFDGTDASDMTVIMADQSGTFVNYGKAYQYGVGVNLTFSGTADIWGGFYLKCTDSYGNALTYEELIEFDYVDIDIYCSEANRIAPAAHDDAIKTVSPKVLTTIRFTRAELLKVDTEDVVYNENGLFVALNFANQGQYVVVRSVKGVKA